MGFKFRKSIKLAPGVKLNLGKKSVGVSVGGKQGGISYNSRTGARARVSAPGTGLSYSAKIGGSSSTHYSTSAQAGYDPSSQSAGATTSDENSHPQKARKPWSLGKIAAVFLGCLFGVAALITGINNSPTDKAPARQPGGIAGQESESAHSGISLSSFSAKLELRMSADSSVTYTARDVSTGGRDWDIEGASCAATIMAMLDDDGNVGAVSVVLNTDRADAFYERVLGYIAYALDIGTADDVVSADGGELGGWYIWSSDTQGGGTAMHFIFSDKR